MIRSIREQYQIPSHLFCHCTAFRGSVLEDVNSLVVLAVQLVSYILYLLIINNNVICDKVICQCLIRQHIRHTLHSQYINHSVCPYRVACLVFKFYISHYANTANYTVCAFPRIIDATR